MCRRSTTVLLALCGVLLAWVSRPRLPFGLLAAMPPSARFDAPLRITGSGYTFADLRPEDGVVALPLLRPGLYRAEGRWFSPFWLPRRSVLLVGEHATFPLTTVAASWILGLVGVFLLSFLLCRLSGRPSRLLFLLLIPALLPGSASTIERAAVVLSVGALVLAGTSDVDVRRRLITVVGLTTISGLWGFTPVWFWPVLLAAAGLWAVVPMPRRVILAVAATGLSGALFLVGAADRQDPRGLSATAQAQRCSQGHSSAAAQFRCAETFLVALGGSMPYEQAENVARDLLREMSSSAVAPGVLCRLGGEALASAAVASGQDPDRVLANGSLCDFSLPHGVAAFVAATADDPATAVTRLCAPHPVGALSENTFGTQCWHGAGQGLARRYSFSLERILPVCELAPDVGFRGNCLEGVFIEERNDAFRTADLPGYARRGPEFRFDQCARSFTEDWSAKVCFRYAAMRSLESLGFERSLRMALEVCAETPGSPDACWYGVGALLSESLEPLTTSRAFVLAAVGTCTTAPTAESRLTCLLRLTASWLSNPDNPLDDEELLYAIAQAAPDLADTVRAQAAEFLDSISGIG